MVKKAKNNGLCIKTYYFLPSEAKNTKTIGALQNALKRPYTSLKNTFTSIVPNFNSFGNADTGCRGHIETSIEFEKIGKLVVRNNNPHIYIPADVKPLINNFYERFGITNRLNGENDFHFIVTNKAIDNPSENDHGALFYFDNERPGNIALFSIKHEISRPYFKNDNLYENKNLVEQYKNLRFGVFLVRNILRFVGGQDFSGLHEPDIPGCEECLMYNPTSDIKSTHEWLVRNLDFRLCSECKKLWEAAQPNNDLNNIEVFISAACQSLKELREKFVFNLNFERKIVR